MKRLKRCLLGPGVSMFVALRVHRLLPDVTCDVGFYLVHVDGGTLAKLCEHGSNVSPQIAMPTTLKVASKECLGPGVHHLVVGVDVYTWRWVVTVDKLSLIHI